MKSQFLIVDERKLDAYPATYANIRRPVELFRASFDQHFLDTNGRRYRHRDMPVVVMVNGAHGKHLFDKEGWFAMREFFRSARQRETNPPNSLDMFCALIGLSMFRCWFHRMIWTSPQSGTNFSLPLTKSVGNQFLFECGLPLTSAERLCLSGTAFKILEAMPPFQQLWRHSLQSSTHKAAAGAASRTAL